MQLFPNYVGIFCVCSLVYFVTGTYALVEFDLVS